jgi:kinesin family member 18/19
MICTVSPSELHYEDVLNTLKYAERTKQIKTTLSRNKYNLEKKIQQYGGIISNFKKEIKNNTKILEIIEEQKQTKMQSQVHGTSSLIN